jgi:hypothetical protein
MVSDNKKQEKNHYGCAGRPKNMLKIYRILGKDLTQLSKKNLFYTDFCTFRNRSEDLQIMVPGAGLDFHL